MDWFEDLTGYKEADYARTRARLRLEGERLRSLVNGRTFAIGRLDIVSLQTLRERVAAGSGPAGHLTVRNVSGDVRQLHRMAAFKGALFQVASQFNLLEMISPEVTPGHGVTCYQYDPTQGPACAIAAGAATLYRNYFVPIDGEEGQTAERQIGCLSGVGAALSHALGRPVQQLWTMKNGYALCSKAGLRAISGHLDSLGAPGADALRGLLQIGVHWDVEVTDRAGRPGPLVSQAFCSALPAAYCGHPAPLWQAFAQLVLEAAYEAVIWTAVLNARRNSSNIVLLTRLGGGAFGNKDVWIDAALRRALEIGRTFDLEVFLVSRGPPLRSMLAVEREFS